MSRGRPRKLSPELQLELDQEDAYWVYRAVADGCKSVSQIHRRIHLSVERIEHALSPYLLEMGYIDYGPGDELIAGPHPPPRPGEVYADLSFT